MSRAAQPFEVRLSALALRNDSVPLIDQAAALTPLYPLRAGRPTFDGINLYVERSASAQAGREWGIAMGGTPGWVGALDNYRYPNGRFYLQEGYFKFGYGRAELTFGRTALQFGDTAQGSLLFSGASHPLNLLKFALRSYDLPLIGPFTFETWVTTPTASHLVNNSRFMGAMVGFRPAGWIEFGLMEIFQFEGAGKPSLDASDVLGMAVYSSSDQLAGKRQKSMALQLGVWAFEQTAKIYSQVFFEQLTRPANWLKQDMSVLLGLWLPRIGSGEFRLEYVHTVPHAYRSTQWPQGLSYLGSTLGHPIGADGEGVYVDVGLPSIKQWRPMAV